MAQSTVDWTDAKSAGLAMAGNWRRFKSFGWHDQPDGAESYAVVYTVNRDSGLLEQSNSETIAKALARFVTDETGDVIEERHSHWACGWVAGFAIRRVGPTVKLRPLGKLTAA